MDNSVKEFYIRFMIAVKNYNLFNCDYLVEEVTNLLDAINKKDITLSKDAYCKASNIILSNNLHGIYELTEPVFEMYNKGVIPLIIMEQI